MAFPSSVDELGFPCEGGTDTVDFDGSEAPLTGRRKKMAKKPKSGGFESLELLPEIYRALKLKGYQLPTPVQRKTLPLALAGHDVVAMARTGSGKTAAFVVPMLQRLRERDRLGARGVVLSPSRELALQTFKFCRELGKFLNLRYSLLVGGDSLEAQFEQLAAHPDVLVATPGRLMHHLQEVEGFHLKTVQMVVFDEADRLFEMGFAEQLRQIMKAIPENRQTMLVSATMPAILAEFARAGLVDPQVVRLDTETRISPDLRTVFLTVRAEEKTAALLYLLKEIISEKEQTIVFASTRHHVEYLGQLMVAEGLRVSMVYGEMDQTARGISVAKFAARKSTVLVVTDVAARGIDIPLLDNVVNFDFPARAKLFVHRVGRAARAGRSGTAFSLLVREELGYLVDLSLFLGKPLSVAPPSSCQENAASQEFAADAEDRTLLGTFPQAVLDSVVERVRVAEKENSDINALIKVCANAFRMYLRSRPGASAESARRASDLPTPGVHPYVAARAPTNLQQVEGFAAFASMLKSFRPQATVMEAEVAGSRVGKSKGDAPVVKGIKTLTQGAQVMQRKREAHTKLIVANTKALEDRAAAAAARNVLMEDETRDGEGASDANVGVSLGRFRDEAFFVRSTPCVRSSERDMAVHGNTKGLDDAILDIMPEDADGIKQMRSVYTWDKRKKAYVKKNNGTDDQRRGEKRGAPDNGKSSKQTLGDLYKQWQKKTHRSIGGDEEGYEGGRGDDESPAGGRGGWRGRGRGVRGAGRGGPRSKSPGGVPNKSVMSELKGADQLRKERAKKQKMAERGGGRGGRGRGGGGGAGGRGGGGQKRKHESSSGGSRGSGMRGGKGGGRGGGKRQRT